MHFEALKTHLMSFIYKYTLHQKDYLLCSQVYISPYLNTTDHVCQQLASQWLKFYQLLGAISIKYLLLLKLYSITIYCNRTPLSYSDKPNAQIVK